jgi:negative regulator of replication initiation
MGEAMKQIDDISNSRTTWAEDESVESAVLRQLLDLHPTRLTMAELTREVTASRDSFAERDAVERAVRDLTATGLLHQGEEFVAPTRAALRFSELLDR